MIFISDVEELNRRIYPLFKKDWNTLQKEIEEQKEKDIIHLLKDLDIHSSIKIDKKSLPYQYVISHTRRFSSFVNETFYIGELYRKLVKHLLEEDVYKIRFFLETELFYNEWKNSSYIIGIKYHIKYYIHKN